jgi:agmatinase
MGFVKLLGVPYTVGCRAETASAIDQQNGPRAIRDAIRALTANYSAIMSFDDIGDVKAKAMVEDVLGATTKAVGEIVKRGDIPLILGGAHTISLGTMRALAESNPGFSLVYIDAHPDIMPRPQVDYGSVLFHAIKEELVEPKNIAIIGMRQIEDPEYRIIEEQGIFHLHSHEVCALGVHEVVRQIRDRIPGPYMVSFDIDSVDPAFAPGVTSPYPCGLSSGEALALLEEVCKAGVLAMEVVEMSPINDYNDATARLAASIILRVSRLLGPRNRAN